MVVEFPPAVLVLGFFLRWHVPEVPFKDAEEGFDVDVDFTDEEDVDADGEAEFVSPTSETKLVIAGLGQLYVTEASNA